MTRLRIGFLFRRPYGAGHVSIFPKTLQMLAHAGVVSICNEIGRAHV